MHGTDTQEVDASFHERLKGIIGAKLCVRGNGMPPKERKFVVIPSLGPDHNLGVYHNNIRTITRAFVERYFFCQVGDSFRPALAVCWGEYNKDSLRTFRDTVMQNMPKLPRLSRQQVVDRYTGTKHRLYTEAMLSLSRESLHRKDSRLTSFVKFEKQDVGKAPRVINPRSPRFNLVLGTFIKHAEKPFFRAINKAFGARTPATVIKGMNADVSASVIHQKWERFKCPVAIGLDATKFDMHVSTPALKYEHSFYKLLFPGSKELKDLLKWQLFNSGIARAADGEVAFSMHGTRASGDLNTSLGNCLIMCSLVWSFFREIGVDVELCNNGDDCVVIMEREFEQLTLDTLPAWFSRKGFAMTVEQPVYDFDQIEFCQTKPVKLHSGWRMVRNHAAVLKKDPMCMIPINRPSDLRKWMWAVGECGAILASGVPVQSAFYECLLRHGEKCSAGMKDAIFKGTSAYQRIDGLKSSARITDEARVSYYYAFGITPDQQLCLEHYYKTFVIDEMDTSAVARDSLVLQPGISLLL